MSGTKNSLFDADAASAPALAAARASTTVGDADAAYRADVIAQFLAVRGDWSAELALLAEASRYDKANPAPVHLYDELHAIGMYSATQYGEAA